MEKLKLENRIHLLKSRNKYNNRIVQKLERKLKKLKDEE